MEVIHVYNKSHIGNYDNRVNYTITNTTTPTQFTNNDTYNLMRMNSYDFIFDIPCNDYY